MEVRKDLTSLPIGKAEIKLQGKRLALLAFGSMVAPAIAAGAALNATVVNMRFVKPIDATLLAEIAASHDALVTIEEHVVAGGAAACAEALAQVGIAKPMLHLGLPDRFIDHGDHALLLKREGLDGAGIEASVRARFADLLSGDGRTRLVASR